MAGHMPYLLPDGRTLAQVLKSQRDGQQVSGPKKKKSYRGKDEVWQQLLSQKARALGTSSELDLAELKAVEAAGFRRRRRWLNEKLLRDMAGPLSAQDMEAQFKPAPFGYTGHVSPLTQALQPENSSVWEHFRSVDPDKEAKVLQKWEEHNQQNRASSSCSQQSPAAAALKSWASIGRKARQALKNANVHSVLQLEMQLLDFLEKGDTGEQLVLEIEDSFGRLLVHGLADFYDLLCCSKLIGTQQCTLVYRRPTRQMPSCIPTVVCTDILLAMAEVGELNQKVLQEYVDTHLHGYDSDYVYVPAS